MGANSYAYDSPGTVSAVFFGKMDAEKAYSGLLRLGYTENEISLLMSDETLDKHAFEADQVDTSDDDTPVDPTDNNRTGRARILIANAIISFTSMISFPDLGISISKRLIADIPDQKTEKSVRGFVASKVPDEHCDTYETGMREGGIIISVDPRNMAEKADIIREFRNSNGHDILGDDGYTELD